MFESGLSSAVQPESGSILASMRVVLVEDDPALLRVLERGLRAHGFDAVSVSGSEELESHIADPEVGIALLDLSSAAAGGADLVRRVRAAREQLPIVALTSSNGALSVPGVDDALTKPFALEELIARIHARTRGSQPRATTLVAGDVRLDLLARCAWRGDRLIDLPAREFALLEYFIRHASRVLPRTEILADVWGYDVDPASNVVDVYVRYLRNRLDVGGQPSLITTVRGSGYRFDPAPVETSLPS
jgi:DNA-binding response OmpR family regulator